MKRSTKYTIKKGKVVLNKSAKPKAKRTGYERYLGIAHDSGLPKSIILTEEEYNTTVVSNKQRNIPAKPDAIVRQQLRDGVTDREFRARLNAVRRVDSTMTRKKFNETRGWEAVESLVLRRYEELKAIYHYDELKDKKDKKIKTTLFARMIATEIYGSE